MTNTKDITVDQGSSLTYVFTLLDSNGAPFSLTSFDARLQVRRSFGATSTLINCTLANSKLTITAPNIITLKLLPTDTSTIRFNAVEDDTLDAVYDLEIITPTLDVFKPARGAFTINREVTR
jgi:hypothetical protein